MLHDQLWPVLLISLLTYAIFRKLPVYDLFVEGAKEGMHVAVQVLPNLAAMLVAVSLMEQTGLIERLCSLLEPAMGLLGLPKEIAPLVTVRPLSGSAALAVLERILAKYGPDSRIGLAACTAMGAGETIFYTVCVYLSGLTDRRTGYTIPCALLGMLAGLWTAGLFFR